MYYSILIISNIILIIFIVKCRADLKRSKNQTMTKENEIVKEILDLGLMRDFNKSYVIIEALKKYYKIDYCSVLINRNKLHCISTNVEDKYIEDVESKCISILKDLGGAAKISNSESYFDYKSSQARKIKYTYFIPLKTKFEIIGAIYIENKEDYKESKFELDFFNLVIKNITMAVQSCVYSDEIMQLAMRDNLTGIFNRNYMDKYIKALVNSSDSIVIAIMDIDKFKSVNDTYGHDFGDKVLIGTSSLIKGLLKSNEEVYRWGGEEFIISFCNVSIDEAERRLNFIREEISKQEISNDIYNLKVTASFGVSSFDGSLFKTINKADKALYESKESGRNKVTVYR